MWETQQKTQGMSTMVKDIRLAHMRPWTTVLSRWGIFVAIAKNTLYGSNLSETELLPVNLI